MWFRTVLPLFEKLVIRIGGGIGFEMGMKLVKVLEGSGTSLNSFVIYSR